MIKTKNMVQTGYTACNMNIRKAYKIVVDKPEWKRQIGKFRRGQESMTTCVIDKQAVKCMDQIKVANVTVNWRCLVKT